MQEGAKLEGLHTMKSKPTAPGKPPALQKEPVPALLPEMLTPTELASLQQDARDVITYARKVYNIPEK